jgi:hypothetical protein
VQVIEWLIKAGVPHWQPDAEGLTFLGRVVAHDNSSMLDALRAWLNIGLDEVDKEGEGFLLVLFSWCSEHSLATGQFACGALGEPSTAFDS